MVQLGPMHSPQTHAQRHTGKLYAAFAYASVVLTSFAGFFTDSRYYGPAWCVPVVFTLGALYVALGILGGGAIDGAGKLAHGVYYSAQCVLLTAILFLSPSRGFMGILVLPLVSQSIFDLRPIYAGAIALYLYALNLTIWAIPYGWKGAMNAFIGYAASFAFTIVFTYITRQAIFSRRRADELRKQVEAANEQLREQAKQMEELATTRERNRLAREIHDGVGHYLTVVKTQLDAAAALLPAEPGRAREAVTKAARLAGEALDDVRRSVGTLRTDSGRPPLADAIKALTHDAGVSVTVRVEGTARLLPSGIEHALFRSAQEGLTNVCKHAAASAAEIALDFRANDRVKLTIVDNGRGANGVGPSGGFGLRGIRERVELLGGKIAAANRDEGGFTLTVEVPA